MSDRVTIGNVEVMAFLDFQPPPYPISAFFPDIPLEHWEPYKPALLKDGTIQLYFTCFVICSGNELILVDTGIGPGSDTLQGYGQGQLLDLLGQHGIQPGDITTVVHTHLHADHVGWNVSQCGGDLMPTFHNARYLVPRADWDHIRSPSMQVEAAKVRDCVDPLSRFGVMDLIQGDHMITSDVRTIAVPGHTPGHLCISITSAGTKAAIAGDLFHVPAQVREPNWCALPDWDKELSRRSRANMLAIWEQDETIIGAGHFQPEEWFGRIGRYEGRRCWQVV